MLYGGGAAFDPEEGKKAMASGTRGMAIWVPLSVDGGGRQACR